MSLVVLDTNVLVYALWTPKGKASAILTETLSGNLQACYDYRILKEYREVLCRPKFHFSLSYVFTVLDSLSRNGVSVVPPPLPDAPFTDEDDRAFYEVAKFCHAPLITGNVRHFPDDPCITTIADFYRNVLFPGED